MTTMFYVLLGVLFAGYFGLAGADYGVGMLLRRTARADTERRLVLGAVGPFFLGNEVWLVASLGLLLGAFPLAEGELLSQLYPIMVPLMAGLLLFTAAVQIRSRFTAARGVWDGIIVTTAFVIAGAWGAALGAVLQGFPLRFGPLPVLTAAMMVALLILHGAVLLQWRAPGEVAARARDIARRMTFPVATSVVLAALTVAARGGAVQQPLLAGMGAVVLLAAVLSARRLLIARRPGWALVATGIAACLPVLITGAALLPYFAVHTQAASLTVSEAAAGPRSLQLLTIAALPVLPVLMAFQAATWWIWRQGPRQPNFY